MVTSNECLDCLIISKGICLNYTPWSHFFPSIHRLLELPSCTLNLTIRMVAVGISCAGIALTKAISLLEPLTSDDTDFVRQGALIAMAIVMVSCWIVQAMNAFLIQKHT